MSFPSWERGLKRFSDTLKELWPEVVPLVGTWIETLLRPAMVGMWLVVPLVGTWIETLMKTAHQ